MTLIRRHQEICSNTIAINQLYSNIIDFPDNCNNSAAFKFKQKITGQTGSGDTKDVKIMVSFKYLSNF